MQSSSVRSPTSNAALSSSVAWPRSKLPEFGALREEARAIKDHTLNHLDLYLEAYERKVVESGGIVHYAPSAADAPRHRAEICKEAGARLVTKGKSMVSEEIGLNAHLEAAGIEVARPISASTSSRSASEPPSHIIAPVIHLNKEEIAEDFVRTHRGLAADRALGDGAGPRCRSTRRAAREIPCRRCRHHRRQPADRRDWILGDRHQ